MADTPKLDELEKHIEKYSYHLLVNGEGEDTMWYRTKLQDDALMEIREILKTVRQKSLP